MVRPPAQAGLRIGFVPTMGALHDGHLRLVDVAARPRDRVVVSIFVNPMQFNRRDDFDALSRARSTTTRRLCEAAGVEARVRADPGGDVPGGLPDPRRARRRWPSAMEGAAPPGHFRGVTTVVTKLFHAVRPDVAVFGEKDFQQLAIIRRMAADLDFGIEIVGVPTVREPDGLAMSSRNRPPRRRRARRGAVRAGRRSTRRRAAVAEGTRRAAQVVAAVRQVIAAEPLARLEYAEVCDPVSLERVDLVTRPVVLAVAVWFGEVRLIDNVALEPREGS